MSQKNIKFEKNETSIAGENASQEEVSTGGIIEDGLWNYTRHPNYLGEVLMWWSVGLMGFFSMGCRWDLLTGVVHKVSKKEKERKSKRASLITSSTHIRGA